jgi:predicted metal-dependent HD superfamily phosphohydrolase
MNTKTLNNWFPSAKQPIKDSTQMWNVIECLARSYYNEPHRVYHTWDHVINMLNRWHSYAAVRNRLRSPTSVERLAVIWHDAVYIPGRQDNEERSIELMCMVLKRYPNVADYFSGDDIQMACELILSTKYPFQPRIKQAAYISDLDLIGFSYSKVDFIKNNTLIDDEFSHVEKYAKGRLNFLMEMLNRRPFYNSIETAGILVQTGGKKMSINELAYRNIVAEIERVKGNENGKKHSPKG